MMIKKIYDFIYECNGKRFEKRNVSEEEVNKFLKEIEDREPGKDHYLQVRQVKNIEEEER